MFAPLLAKPLPKAEKPTVVRATAAPGLAHMASALAASGRPLDPASLARFESSFASDFSEVRVHSDERAAASAHALAARAYTVGNHIVFGRGEYAPQTSEGRFTLAHELAHVVQQGRDSSAAAGTPVLETGADRAAERVGRGEQAEVEGSGRLGVARRARARAAEGPPFDWPALKARIAGDHPVSEIAATINGLATSDPGLRDKAIAEIIAERNVQNKKAGPETDSTGDKEEKSGTPEYFIRRSEEVLHALFAASALSATHEDLKTGAKSAATRQEIKTAMDPQFEAAEEGAKGEFQDQIDGETDTYADEIRIRLLAVIEEEWKDKAAGRTEKEHADPTQVYDLPTIEAIARVSQRETDKLFGRFYGTRPAIKAGTKDAPGNLVDRWQASQAEVEETGAKDYALGWLSYFLESDDGIDTINEKHRARPRFDGTFPDNSEARKQRKVAEELIKDPAVVEKLTLIGRLWPAMSTPDAITIQLFKPTPADPEPAAAEQSARWTFFIVLVHEYCHTLAHPDYLSYVENEPSTEARNTLTEGVTSLLTETVWSNIVPRLADKTLHQEIEGSAFSDNPHSIDQASVGRYPSYEEALKLVELVGIRNLYAAYFMGEVNKIAGVKRPRK